MNFLRGMMDFMDAGTNVKALRQIKKEIRNWGNIMYILYFDLTEKLEFEERGCGYKLTDGFIQLISQNNCLTHGTLIFYDNKLSHYQFCSRRTKSLHRDVPVISELGWNEEVHNFRQAFLNGDPSIHDEIRATILSAIGKKVCSKCLNEKTEYHVCTNFC